MTAMSYEYPAKPDVDPSGPERDGFPDIEVGRDYMELTLADGEKLRIPGIAIQRDGFRVTAGGRNSVNELEVTFHAGRIAFVDDDTDWTEVVRGRGIARVDA
jgi:hypothetical protein